MDNEPTWRIDNGPKEPREEFEPEMGQALLWAFYLGFSNDNAVYIVDIRFERIPGNAEGGEVVIEACSIGPLKHGWFAMRQREDLDRLLEAFRNERLYQEIDDIRRTFVEDLERERRVNG